MKTVSAVAAFLLVAIVVAAQSVAPPDVPGDLKAPAGEKVILSAHAKGVQIY